MERIIRQPNAALECIGAICRALSPDEPEKTVTELRPLSEALEKYAQKYEGARALKENIYELNSRVLEGIDLNDEFIKHCFSLIPDDSMSLAEYIVLCENSGGAEVLNIDHDNFFMLLALAQSELISEEDIQEYPKKINLGIFTRAITMSTLPKDAKMIYIEAASMYDSYVERLNAILDDAKARYEANFHLVKDAIDDFCDDIDLRIEKAGGIQALLKNVGLALDCESITLCPSVIFFNSIRTMFTSTILKVFMPEGDIKDEISLCYGIYFNLGSDAAASSEYVARTALKQLKALDDQTRFDIMCALKKGDQCGADLARLLSVTPATISHHMNELTSAGLVSIEKKGVKFMYSTNKEGLKQFQSAVAQLLL